MAQDLDNAVDGLDVDIIRGTTVLALCRAIIYGIVNPVPQYETWKQAYCGNVSFTVGNATVVVFNDCDEFDYIDSIVVAGMELDYDDRINDWIEQGLSETEYNLLTEKFIKAE